MDTKKLVAWVLVVGAINWGLVGFFNLNAVELIFGTGSLLTKIVYVVVGAAGIYKAYLLVNDTCCKKK